MKTDMKEEPDKSAQKYKDERIFTFKKLQNLECIEYN
jgi:hypothetical protein